jgi:hypothetical protein
MKSSLTPLSSLISTSARSASAFTTMPIVTVGQRPSRRTRLDDVQDLVSGGSDRPAFVAPDVSRAGLRHRSSIATTD